MMITTPREQTKLVAAPKLYEVYTANDGPPDIEWVIEGTDSKLYTVPCEPGGWLLRCEYHGEIGDLTTLSQKEARFICWRVYGDVGRVTMEGANLEPR